VKLAWLLIGLIVTSPIMGMNPVDQEVLSVRKLQKELDKFFTKYPAYRTKDFSNLERRRQEAYLRFEKARSAGVDPKEWQERRFQYYKALHYELNQKLLTLESEEALSTSAFLREFLNGCYSDIEWIARHIDWKEVFKSIFECGKDLDLSKCTDILSIGQSFLLQMIEKTWKRRFILRIQRETGATEKIAESIWDDLVMPKVEEPPYKKQIDEAVDKMSEKAQEKLEESLKRRLKDNVKKHVKYLANKSEKEVKEYLQEQAKKTAESLVSSTKFASDIFWKLAQIMVGEALTSSELSTYKSLIELAKKAAGCSNCPDEINRYYFDHRLMRARLKELNIHVKIPRTKANRQAPPSRSEVAEKQVEEVAKKSELSEFETFDFRPLYRALETMERDFHQGRLYYIAYIEKLKSLRAIVGKKNKKCLHYYPMGCPFKKFMEKSRAFYKKIDDSLKAAEAEYERGRRRCSELLRIDDEISQKSRKQSQYRVEVDRRLSELRKIVGGYEIDPDQDTERFRNIESEINSLLVKAVTEHNELMKKAELYERNLKEFILQNPSFFWNEGRFSPAFRGCGKLFNPFSPKIEALRKSEYRLELNPKEIREELSRLEERLREKLAFQCISSLNPHVSGPKRCTQKSFDETDDTVYGSFVRQEMDRSITVAKVESGVIKSDVKLYDLEKAMQAPKKLTESYWKMIAAETGYRSLKLDATRFKSDWSEAQKNFEASMSLIRRFMVYRNLSQELISRSQEFLFIVDGLKSISSIPKAGKLLKKSGVTFDTSAFGQLERKNGTFSREIDSIELFENCRQVRDTYHQRFSKELDDGGNGRYFYLPHSKEQRWIYYVPLYVCEQVRLSTRQSGKDKMKINEKWLNSFLNRYPTELISAHRSATPQIRDKCREASRLDHIMARLEKRYDESLFLKASRYYEALRQPLKNPPVTRTDHVVPYLRYPCSVRKTVRKYEFYTRPPLPPLPPSKNKPLPKNLTYEVKINGKTRREFAKMFGEGTIPKIFSTNPMLKIETGTVDREFAKRIREVSIRVCPAWTVGVNGSRSMERTCRSTPHRVVAKNGFRFRYLYRMPKKGLIYRIRIKVRLDDGTELTPAGYPYPVHWVADTTDDDENIYPPSENNGRGKAEESDEESHTGGDSTHVSTGNTGEADMADHGKGYQDGRQKGPSPKKDKESELCSSEYHSFVRFYNRLTSLMAQGKGDSTEAVRLYQKYKEARARYETCRRRKKGRSKGGSVVNVSSASRDGEAGSGAKKEGATHSRGLRLENPSLAESWFKGWKVLSLPRDTRGGTGKIFASQKRFGWFSPARDVGDAVPPKGGHGAVLYLHPTSQKKPAVLKKRIYSNGNQQLFIRVAGNRNGDFRLVVRIDGRKIFSRVIDGKKWHELHIPIDKKGSLELEVDIEANGWYYEYAFIDTMQLVSPEIHADPGNMLSDDGKGGHKIRKDGYGRIDYPGRHTGKNLPHGASRKARGVSAGRNRRNGQPKGKETISGCQHNMECGYDRPGLDYRWFSMRKADPKICLEACKGDKRCKAWTYVSPGIQGKRGRCWLKRAVPKKIRREGMVSGVVSRKVSGTKSGKSGPRILDVRIATKALSQIRPGPGAVTDRLPAGTRRFYIFVRYDGFTPHNRVDILWYLRPSGGGTERLLFQENGGHLPKRRGVFSAPVEIQGGVLPSGLYRIVFRIDGRERFEKRFTIGE